MNSFLKNQKNAIVGVLLIFCFLLNLVFITNPLNYLIIIEGGGTPPPPPPGIQWYNFQSFPKDQSSWSSNYWNWLDEWRIVKQTTGTFPGNKLSVSFQPRSYVQSADFYNLDYSLGIHVETDTGDDDYWPQPTIDDDGGFYYYPAPMAVQQVKITTTLLPLVSGTDFLIFPWTKADQPSQNTLQITEGAKNTLLGRYSSKNSEMMNLVLNGNFDYADEPWVEYDYTTGSVPSGAITYDYNYGHYRYGVKIKNDYGHRLGIRNLDCKDAYGAKKLNIAYWGKRISTDAGTSVGVDLYIKFTDGSHMWLMPNELRMTYKDGVWHHYQYSFETQKTISYFRVYALNYEYGTAYFDQIYVTTGAWKLSKVGDWLQGNYEDTYDDWWNAMEQAQLYRQALGTIGLAVKTAGLAASLLGYGAIGLLCGVAGYFLLPSLVSVPSTIIRGQEKNNYQIISNYDHKYGDRTSDGQFGYVLACDDTMIGTYKLWRDDLDVKKTRSFQITIEVWWSYIGDSDWLNICPGDDCADYASITLQIDCSNYHWVP